MATDLNQCTFTGRLGADPEVRSFQNGGSVCNLRLAVGEQWKDRNGERQERTEWISVSIFNDGLIGIAREYLRKGSQIFVQGKWKTRKWQDQSGADRYTTECVLQGFDAKLIMLDRKSESRREADGSQGHAGSFQDDPLDDDIPFISKNSVW